MRAKRRSQDDGGSGAVRSSVVGEADNRGDASSGVEEGGAVAAGLGTGRAAPREDSVLKVMLSRAVTVACSCQAARGGAVASSAAGSAVRETARAKALRQRLKILNKQDRFRATAAGSQAVARAHRRRTRVPVGRVCGMTDAAVSNIRSSRAESMMPTSRVHAVCSWLAGRPREGAVRSLRAVRMAECTVSISDRCRSMASEAKRCRSVYFIGVRIPFAEGGAGERGGAGGGGLAPTGPRSRVQLKGAWSVEKRSTPALAPGALGCACEA